METWIDGIGMAAGIILPVFNIPLIVKVVRRKSSRDISLLWVLGVWTCFFLMFPAALKSEDMVFRAFSVANMIMFSGVVFVTFKYRKGFPSS